MVAGVNTPPPFPVDSPEVQRRTDDEHINLLSIFHFVGAGFALLGLGCGRLALPDDEVLCFQCRGR